MLSTRYLGAALVLATAVACGESSTTSPTAPESPVSLRADNGRDPNGKASGHVEVNLYGYFDIYTFEAMTKGGEVTGRFQWQSDQPNGELTRGAGRVVCLTIIGNVAHLGGELNPNDVHWSPPPFNHAVWTVVDNDRGPGDAPDLASLVTAFKTRAQVEAHCRTGGLALAPLDRGDVKVRGGTNDGAWGVAGGQ